MLIQKYYCFYILLIFISCEADVTSSSQSEVDYIEIKLNKDIAIPKAEFSGLDWYENELILLPQYPDRFDSKYNGCLFSISKSAITNYIQAKKTNPIIHTKIELDSKGFDEQIEGFQGYEAIVFKGNNLYLAIEAQNLGKMSAYVIKGEIDLNANKITLQPKSLKEIPLPADLDNMAIETLLIVDERVVAIYEANGKNVNAQPKIISFDLDLQNHESIPFPNIEYRITDATQIDKNKFWAINYLYEGEKELLNPAHDILSQNQTAGIQSVERIVKFKLNKVRLNLTNELPVQIKLCEDNESRNWEGIVKYDSLGFLLITDKFPKTILAYIPYSMGVNDLFVSEENGKFGFNNSLNVTIIKPRYIFAQEFSDFGIAAVVDDSGWVYINKSGDKIIRPHVVDNGPDYFSFGLARFKSNNKYGYFDEKGNKIILPQYDYAKPFADSMAAVCQGCQFLKKDEHLEVVNGKWGFINIEGELVISYNYNKVSDFNNGYATVEKNGKSISISRK